MADRSVTLNVGMSMQGFVSELNRGEGAAKSFSAQMQNLSRTNTKAFQETKQAADDVAKGAALVGGAAALALGGAIKAYADFDERMTQVRTLTHATADQMRDLEQSALTAGQSIGVSATEAADAQIELVKAGVSVADINSGALRASLDLAAAGQMNVADATAIASSTMVQFGLKGQDASHIADLLAAGADKALGSVGDLGEGLKYVGPVAASLGVSLEQTVGTLALFAQNGILGEQAGTSLRGVLLSLVAPSGAAKKAMQEYGIELYDSQGKFIGVDGAAEVLHQRLGTLDESTRNAALGQIFGNAQITAATILYNGGAKEVDKWTKAVNEAGFAQEQAEGKLDTLNGDVQKFAAAWETAGIVTGQAADGPLRKIVQVGTDMLNAYINAPGVVQAAAFAVLALVAAVGLGSAAMLTGVPRIVEYTAALRTLGQSNIPLVSGAANKLAGANTRVLSGLSATAGFLGGPWGIAIGLGVSAVGLLNTELEKLKATDEEVAHTLRSAESVSEIYKTLNKGQIWSPGVNSITDQLKDMDGALQAFASHNSSNGFFAILTRFTNADYNQGLNALRGINKEMGELAQTDPSRAVETFKLLADQTDGSVKEVGRLVDAIGGDYRAALVKQADALGITADRTNLAKLALGKYADAAKGAEDPTKSNAEALQALQEAAGQAAPSIDDVAKALQALTSPTLDAREASRQYQAAIADIVDTLQQQKDAYKEAHGNLDGFSASLDRTTENGRANEAALDGLASSAQNLAAKLIQQGSTQEEATAAMQRGRDELVKQLGQYGITGQAAQDYADKIIGTPTEWATAFSNNAPGEGTKVDELTGKIRGVPSSKETKLEAKIAEAERNLEQLKSKIGTVPKSKSTELRAEVAAAQQRLAALRAQLDGIRSKTITVTTVNNNLVADGTRGKGLGVMKATGGPIIGPGTGTSDSIPAWLSNGEHVWTASEVEALGGHARMKELRNAVLAGMVSMPGFATGGPVGGRPDVRYAPLGAQQIVVQAPASGGDVFAPVLQSTGSFRDDLGSVMYQYRTFVRGRRRR